MNKFRLTIVAVLAILLSTVSYAQKGSVTKAETYMNKGELADAKAEIDVAITIEKTASRTKPWYVRGQVYEAIAKSEDMAVNSLDPDALEKSVSAYNKVLEMEKATSSYATLSQLNLDALWGTFLNKGSVGYGEENYEVAMLAFEQALKVKPTDSTTLLYTGAAAQQAGVTENTLKYYGQMIELGYASVNVYSVVIFMHRQAGNNEKALEYTLLAKEAYPNDKNFASEELSLLMVMNKLDEAKTKLSAAIEKDPTVVINHLNLAVLYDNEGSKLLEDGKPEEARAAWDKAVASYDKAIEMDADNFVGNYNCGAIFVNHAKEYLDKARDMDLKTYQKQGPALEEKAKGLLKKAIPYFENVIRIEPTDLDAHLTLQGVYSTLKMYDEAEAMMNKVEELEAAQGVTQE